MSRIHLRSNTLVLCLSLSAALAASALSIGCSSSDSGAEGGAGKGGGGRGGATATAGSSSSEAGEAAVGGEGGSEEMPPAGGAGTTGSAGTTGGAGKSGTAGGGGSPAGGSTGGGEAGDTSEGGAGGSAEEPDPRVAAAQARALELINSLSNARKCTTCHDVSYQGSGFFPNITPHVDNGIGSWDDEDIKVAIRDGKDKDGVTLCATMERYPFTDDQLTDLAIFLKHLPPKDKKITAKCP